MTFIFFDIVITLFLYSFNLSYKSDSFIQTPNMRWETLAFLTLLISQGDACARDHAFSEFSGLEERLVKRDVAIPPALSDDEKILSNSFDNNSISDWSYYYTHGLHLAGKNKTMADWTADKWNEYGIPTSLISYYSYLDYPVSASLSLKYSNGSKWDADLQERVLSKDETTSYPNRVPIFHGFSANGSATAEYVYVGRGQQVDFDRLVELKVPLEGKIAISRYGGPFR